jgi:hypothetical protein
MDLLYIGLAVLSNGAGPTAWGQFQADMIHDASFRTYATKDAFGTVNTDIIRGIKV